MISVISACTALALNELPRTPCHELKYILQTATFSSLHWPGFYTFAGSQQPRLCARETNEGLSSVCSTSASRATQSTTIIASLWGIVESIDVRISKKSLFQCTQDQVWPRDIHNGSVMIGRIRGHSAVLLLAGRQFTVIGRKHHTFMRGEHNTSHKSS